MHNSSKELCCIKRKGLECKTRPSFGKMMTNMTLQVLGGRLGRCVWCFVILMLNHRFQWGCPPQNCWSRRSGGMLYSVTFFFCHQFSIWWLSLFLFMYQGKMTVDYNSHHDALSYHKWIIFLNLKLQFLISSLNYIGLCNNQQQKQSRNEKSTSFTTITNIIITNNK